MLNHGFIKKAKQFGPRLGSTRGTKWPPITHLNIQILLGELFCLSQQATWVEP